VVTTNNCAHGIVPDQKPISIDPLTVSSLLIISGSNDNILSSATGFVVEHRDKPYLITNWHVVNGRHPETGKPLSDSAALPDALAVFHHSPERIGNHVRKIETLYNPDETPRWIEHPKGRDVDVVALPLIDIDGVRLYPFDLALADTPLETAVGMPVSIIGFPFGTAAIEEFPIWKTGHIATEPWWDFKGRPVFLIDATTRSGMSGSPVVLRRSDGIGFNPAGALVLASPENRFLGVYASRPDESLELGNVWKPQVIHEILAEAL